MALGVLLGVAPVGFGRRGTEPSVWVADIAVGAIFVAAGGFTFGRSRTVGGLLLATGSAWFVDSLTAWFVFLHRGPLVHLLLVVPAGRRVGRLGGYVVGLGYAAAVWWPLWAEPGVAVGLVALIAFVGLSGPIRIGTPAERRVSAAAIVLFGGVVVAAALVLSMGGSRFHVPMVHAYELVMVAIAAAVAGSTLARPAVALSDLLIDLGDTRSTALRDAFADALGDPTLQLGHWTSDPAFTSGGYLAPDGTPLTIPVAGSTRKATFIERNHAPVAVLVHDASVLDDAAVVDGVAAATRLQDDNAALTAELGRHVDDLNASRRRLVVAGDRARQRLQQRLDSGAGRRIVGAEQIARTLLVRHDTSGGHLRLAVEHLACTLDDLESLGRGLHPRQLDRGLRAAIDGLASAGPLSVSVDDRLAGCDVHGEIAVAAYFVCAEAMANAIKHADASALRIELTQTPRCVQVAVRDNGVGGADPEGSGLRGLADRVVAFGGQLSVVSATTGTTVRAELPYEWVTS